MHIGLEYNQKGMLSFGGHDISSLAERFSTPLYVYSADLIRKSLQSLQKELKNISHLICYSVKANSNLSILRLMAEEGCGADIVSGGELYRSSHAQVDPKRIVFSGMGKTLEELEAGIHAGILFFSVESETEIFWLSKLAQKLGKEARISLRINPSVEAKTHPYITTGREHDKFGIPSSEIPKVYERTKNLKGIHICGLGFHIGSQITDTSAFVRAAKVLSQTADKLKKKGFSLEYVDVGGGLGIDYKENQSLPSVKNYIKSLLAEIPLRNAMLILEPGRFLVGNAGILITQVLFEKNMEGKPFYIVDAAMNDLLRPSLYHAHHEILSHKYIPKKGKSALGNIVGPICESGDFFARDRALPNFSSGDYAVICSCGAYGFAMSSNYNSRRRAAEVLLEKENASLIRRRENYEDLLLLERL